MPTLKVREASPTAATIFCAAEAVETSRATMSRWRGSSWRKLGPEWLTPPFGMLGDVVGIPASVMTLREFRQRRMVHGDGLVSRLYIARINQVQTDALQPSLFEFQGLGGAVGQVDDPAGNDRSTVVDPDDDSPAVTQVGHPDVASHRKRKVSCGHVVHIVRFSAGGRLSVKNLAIPGGRPNLVWFRLNLPADYGLRSWTSWRR